MARKTVDPLVEVLTIPFSKIFKSAKAISSPLKGTASVKEITEWEAEWETNIKQLPDTTTDLVPLQDHIQHILKL